MNTAEQIVRECITHSSSRVDLWIRFINAMKMRRVAEIGVYRGDFAGELLGGCESIDKYYMIDPWRHLDNWNKPANASNAVFEKFLSETKAKTDFAGERRVFLRGKTTEVMEEIPDGELDFSYVDGDHTLKGITIDLVCVYPKIRMGGWIGGDDFSRTIWQHGANFEPTLVFPFALYFAEAVGARIYGLPYGQFLIEKSAIQSFSFIDFTGHYGDPSLRNQFLPTKVLQYKIQHIFSSGKKFAKKLKRLVSN
jgi:methyltransferase family protein